MSVRQRIRDYIDVLRIPMPEQHIDELIATAERERLPILDLIERLLATPANLRRERTVEGRIRTAKFPSFNTFETFNWDFNKSSLHRADFEQLGTGEFVTRRDNLVFVGESGLGKSHLIESIGRRCCLVGHRVKYVTSAALLEDLATAAGTKTLPNRVRFYGRFDLLIIDELGFDKLELREFPEAPSLLYKVIDHRSQKASTALVTNIDFHDWTEYFGDPPLTMALLDRLVDNAIIHKFKGKSYREHRAKRRRPKKPE